MKDGIKKILKITAIISLIVYLPYIFLMAIGPLGGTNSWGAVGTEFFLILTPLGLLITAFISLIGLLFERSKYNALTILAVCFVTGILFIPTLLIADNLRSYGFYLITKRADPLIRAINEYERKEGIPPQSLEKLVPQYITEIPSGLAPLNYKINDKGWALSADVPIGMLNFDEFFYCPDRETCPRERSMERIGDWIYYHE